MCWRHVIWLIFTFIIGILNKLTNFEMGVITTLLNHFLHMFIVHWCSFTKTKYFSNTNTPRYHINIHIIISNISTYNNNKSHVKLKFRTNHERDDSQVRDGVVDTSFYFNNRSMLIAQLLTWCQLKDEPQKTTMVMYAGPNAYDWTRKTWCDYTLLCPSSSHCRSLLDNFVLVSYLD